MLGHPVCVMGISPPFTCSSHRKFGYFRFDFLLNCRSFFAHAAPLNGNSGRNLSDAELFDLDR